MATLRTLVFFATKDPTEDPDPVRHAFTFALSAAKSGLPAEVRLAGAALNVMHPERIPTGPKGDRLRVALHEVSTTEIKVSL